MKIPINWDKEGIEMPLKNRNWKKIISVSVLISFIAPILYLVFRIATTTNDILPNSGEMRVRSDYVLMLVQCLLGIIAMAIPSFLSRKFKWEIPNVMYYFYVFFLYAAIFLGEIQNFYYRFKYWDLILHTLSGTMIGFLGFSVIDMLNRENENVNLNAFFVAFFAFCFAMTLGGIWEVYEFASDGILGTNMQKYALESGIELQGRDAISDTMEDIIVDSVGSKLFGRHKICFRRNLRRRRNVQIVVTGSERQCKCRSRKPAC